MYTYRFYASETVLVTTPCQNEFILIEPSENVKPESLTNNALRRTKLSAIISYWNI